MTLLDVDLGFFFLGVPSTYHCDFVSLLNDSSKSAGRRNSCSSSTRVFLHPSDVFVIFILPQGYLVEI
jgi:hypothetical protein